MNIEMFERLPQEKQDKIFHAALSEFAAYGFDAASTNRIVKQAGIPKGSLFQYFGDKESLFFYVCGKIERDMEEQQIDTRRNLPSDFVEAILYLFERELNYMKSQPKYLQFIHITVSQPLHPVYQKLAEQHKDEEPTVEIKKFISGISREQLRDDIHFEDILHAITFILDSATQRIEKLIIASEGNLDRIEEELNVVFQELRKCLNLFRYGIYKASSNGAVGS
ncbi:TetR/AcrR family transcriptional regulator [Paenibacillus arenosi]|uniref:TetR/AcrR family transcriptional regulator n=1 Tax=Paenibacillus arenosi TaxID=2774142 RepID=A0ABR9B0C8_9BACL|nr:TetR/AcrR family transcriptional regulator [Paenibacillus arenosi]MBD8499773.1 TetR/AcrR family transcriptional regulator [Paenibacillus arenosi]